MRNVIKVFLLLYLLKCSLNACKNFDFHYRTVFSLYCCQYICYSANWENFFEHHDVLSLVIFSLLVSIRA